MDAIICMAGSARRLNLGQNKVYLKLNDQMIFTYSLNKLAKYCQKIVLSIREEDLDLVRPYLNDQVSYVFGGSERYHSVYNAISKCEANTILIHDGARPFISDKTIQAIIAASQSADLVLPYLPLKGTIYQNEPLKLLNRANTISAQTPQLVKKDYFIKSYLEAIKDNFNWLLTLDQDSKINNEIIAQMVEFLKQNNCKNIGLISPYHDIVTFDEKPEMKVEKKLEVMTSGNIINLKAYEVVGGFKDWLFIDCVDIEYGMNLNLHNYKVLRLNYIVMPHKLGNSQIVNFFWKKVIISNHNATRRYYMIRNALYVNELYKSKYPKYCHMLLRAQLGQIKRIIFLEDDKFQKIKMTIKGVIDYKRKITGKLGGNKHV